MKRQSCLLLLIASILLTSCDTHDPVTPFVGPYSKVNAYGSEQLSFEARSCTYNKHPYIKFRCFQAQRRDGIQHRYPVTVLEPNVNALNIPTVISIPGGPGQGAQTQEDWVQSWADWMQKNNLKLRMVLYEPFGTYGSSAFWHCDAYEALSLRLAAEPINAAEEIRRLKPVTQACLEKLQSIYIQKLGIEEGIAWLNSQSISASLELLIQALPYEKVHLLGTSYGTRVALLSAQNPKVESVVLDSPYPFHRGLMTDWPELLGEAFARHERTIKAYDGESGHYQLLFDNAYQYLVEHPQNWRLERWDGSAPIDFVLTPDRLLLLHYHVLYDENMLPLYYEGLKHLPEKPAELRWVLEDLVTNIFDAQFSSLVYMAVECNDNKTVEKSKFIEEVKLSKDSYTDWDALFEGDVCRTSFFDNKRPIQNEMYIKKPTLILSGELDPVTPTFWAMELAAAIPGSELYVRHKVGHGVLNAEHCLVPRLKQLWNTEDALNQAGGKRTNSGVYKYFQTRCANQR